MAETKRMPLGSLLQILKDSLSQKLVILQEIEVKSKEQAELITNPNVALEDIDHNMDEKSVLIDKLTKLDAGFEALYDNIRKELAEYKDLFKNEIAEIQDLIAKIMEKSTSIEALESRNKTAIEGIFATRKKELQHRKTASSVARHYYEATNRLNVINPQFLDKKK